MGTKHHRRDVLLKRLALPLQTHLMLLNRAKIADYFNSPQYAGGSIMSNTAPSRMIRKSVPVMKLFGQVISLPKNIVFIRNPKFYLIVSLSDTI